MMNISILSILSYLILSPPLCLRFPPPLHSCEQSALVAGRTAHQCCGQGQRSCRAEMQRRPSLFFELPAQPSSAFHRRFSELFSLTDDDIEDAPFCRRTCGCCERPLGSGGVFMAFDKNCAPPPHQLAGRATPGPYPNPNPNLNRHPPTTVSACFCADCSQACRKALGPRLAHADGGQYSQQRRGLHGVTGCGG